jgi:hypothetical protein
VAVVGIGCAATLEAVLLPDFILSVAAMVDRNTFQKLATSCEGKRTRFEKAVRAIELVLGAINLTRGTRRSSMLRTRSR